MKRILRLQAAYLAEIDKYEDVPEKRDKFIGWEKVHMAACGKLGYLLGKARGVDPVLAACACSVHDYGRVITGLQAGHAEAGYLPAQDFLRGTALFTEEEVEQIALAVKNHSRKSEVGTPLEEIVKDADVIDFMQYGFGFAREEQRVRYENITEKYLL